MTSWLCISCHWSYLNILICHFLSLLIPTTALLSIILRTPSSISSEPISVIDCLCIPSPYYHFTVHHAANKDELRARRNREATEREWRRKTKELAERKVVEDAKLKRARLEQVGHKERLLSVEAGRERAEFERVLRWELDPSQRHFISECSIQNQNYFYYILLFNYTRTKFLGLVPQQPHSSNNTR